MIKYLLAMTTLLMMSACSPKYKTIKEYHAPRSNDSATSTACLQTCQSARQACNTTCETTFKTCKIKANQVAQERYEAKIQHYTQQLERYVNEMQLNNFNAYFYDFDYHGYPYYRSRYGLGYGGFHHSLIWYDPMPFYNYAPKPRKPSLKVEQLKAQEEFCDADCGCTQTYDNCYIGCGGEILNKKICIENCSE